MIHYECDRCLKKFKEMSALNVIEFHQMRPPSTAHASIELAQLCERCKDDLQREFLRPLPQVAE